MLLSVLVPSQVCGEVLDFQMRHVSLLPRTPAANLVGSSMAGQSAGTCACVLWCTLYGLFCKIGLL
jgi:hypothetical protein